ncbi:MAG: methyltransferase domain-containing protein [Proteobacteria bacterium]|nr:methyltransferase domain-containing protein [Pseudomonadota bacterium]MBU6425353.1 methyltransferase domain-containing protein [Rhodospirillales bacterium]
MAHAETRKLRISEYVEIEWLDGRSAHDKCRNCGHEGEVEQILAADFIPPGKHFELILQICPRCTARFVDHVPPMDYAADELIELGWHTYQAQVGAGLWPIVVPLAAIDKPAGARILEIGGGYGFGLDICVQALGWQGVGYDPSPLGDYGRRELGLDLRKDYFTEDRLKDGKWDVIVATEVIEHLDDPPGFLRLMRKAIAEDGVLVLTTPDGACITPALSNDELVSPLAAGAHLVLQTAQSLRMALEEAGFAYTDVQSEQLGLTAYASATPLALRDDPHRARALYRHYLGRRAASAALGSDTQIGFATRELFDAANDGDFEAADTAWKILCDGVRQRYGLELETLTALPEGCGTASLSELAARMPLGLGLIFFARAMRKLASGESRATVRPLFELVLQGVGALQQALAQRALDDKLADNIEGITRLELLLCDAEAGQPEVAEALLALNNKVAGWRGFVALVNAGAFSAAARLRDGLGAEPDGAIPDGLRTDALLSLANFHLAPGGDAVLALPVADELAALGAPADEIRLGSFVRLVNGGRYEEALALAAGHDLAAMAARVGGEAARDVGLARAVLELAVGDPAEVPARLQGLTLDLAHKETLLLEAFIRLVNASRYEEALAYIPAHDVAGLTTRVGGETARNTGLARAVLDLAIGDPAEIPARLQGMELEPARYAALLLEAFIRLVNASRYEEARRIVQTHDLPGLIAMVGGETGADGAAAMAVLELAAGDPALVPARLALADVGPARRIDLLLGAFTELVNDARYDEADTLAAAHALLNGLAGQKGQAAEDARWAAMMLDLQQGRTDAAVNRILALENAGGDKALLAGFYVDGFIRLVNDGRYDAARAMDGVEHRLPLCQDVPRRDALAALVMLDAQPGGQGGRVVARLSALEAVQLPEERVTELTLVALSALGNRGESEAARQVLKLAEPLLVKARAPFEAAVRDALFAAGVLHMQEKTEWPSGAATFARLRDSLVKEHPPGEDEPAPPAPLFWPALRGEVVVLQKLKRGEEAVGLLQAYLPAYRDAPEDLRMQVEGR